MRLLRCAGFQLLLVLAWGTSPAAAADPTAWFNRAVEYDLSGTEAAPTAYRWYRRAAEAGLPEAEFNVGVMLDSGRGVQQNVANAALWYGRAAAQGHRRAAYNLGLLYEAGEGVPLNSDVAKAYFSASNLAAAKVHLDKTPARVHSMGPLLAPIPTVPQKSETVGSDLGGVDLVWTMQQYSEPVTFDVEILILEPAGWREVFFGLTETCGLFASLHPVKGEFAWRVTAIDLKAGHYVTSEWAAFSVKDESVASD